MRRFGHFRARLLYMKYLVVALGFLRISVAANTAPKDTGRTIPCKTPQIADSCYWTHGRLSVGNGNPSYRLWKIGTHRILGIYSGPAAFKRLSDPKYALDNEGPELPPNVEEALWHSVSGAWPNEVYADFEVCPLEEERPAAMQAACIESAKNLVVKKSD